MTLAINHRYIVRSLRFLLLAVCVFAAASLHAANVTGVSPTVNSYSVLSNSNIVITFDAAVPVGAVTDANFVIIGSQTGRVAGVLTGGGTNTITFNPAADFKFGEVITVTITAATGLPAAGYAWRFTVISAPVAPAYSTIPPVATNATAAYESYPIDLDRDGDIDLISVSRDGGVAWYENNGSATFAAHAITSTGATGPTSLRAADVDNDGDVDIIINSPSTGFVIVLQNDGSQVFSSATAGSGDEVSYLYTEDMDGDGDVDILAACETTSKIVLYKNDGTGLFTPETIATGVTNINALYAADMDRDGDMDVVASSFDNAAQNNGRITWFENIQTATYTAHTVSTGVQYARGVYAVDMDRDGDMDVVSVSNSNGQIFWHENNGSQTFTDHLIVSVAGDLGVSRSVHPADLDGDGDLDLVAYNADNKQVQWHENNGTQGFTGHVVSTGVVDGVMSLYAADIDGDGDMDVLTASREDNRITWFPNLGTPSPNRVPFFTKGADIQVNEDAGLQTRASWATAISAGAANESVQTMEFILSNTNPDLFAVQPSIDAAGTLTFRSADNAFGTATVTVVLRDDSGTANGGVDQSAATTFVITVLPVNDAPRIDAIADMTLPVNSAPVQVRLTGVNPGPGEATQQVTVTASSNSPFIIANPAVTRNGDGTWTLVLTPAPGATGTVIITVVVRDDGGTERGGVDQTTITFNVFIDGTNGGHPEVFIPTLFSPNGDGSNDTFYVMTSDVAAIRFSVYSPDGHVMFQTTDIVEATERGWNGRYHGRDMPAGTYTWTLEGHFNDGTPFTSRKFGQVMLLR